MNDPFERLGSDLPPTDPRPEFTTALRSRLEMLLELPNLRPGATLPATKNRTTLVTPYLTVNDASAALGFYATAFGAVELQRVTMDDGRIGHAEFQVDNARFYLSDEFPEMNVVSPTTLGGTAVALHVEVDDVDDRFASAIAAGATAQVEPADQPHGARHGTLIDPFGHRWMLSQQVEIVDAATYAERLAVSGMSLSTDRSAPPTEPTPAASGIWPALNFTDAVTGIAFMTEVLGFVADLIVPDEDPTKVAHSQLRWPEGGIVQAASANRIGNVFSLRPVGAESLYVITADPTAVLNRCLTAGVELLVEPESPDYDPGGMVFSIRDPEGNIWSFGTYAGER